MKIIKLIPLIVLACCSSKPTEITTLRTLMGEIQGGIFSNGYLKMDIPENWTELEPRDEGQFLIISKIKPDFQPSIILFVLDRNFYTSKYGYSTAEKYVRGLTDHYLDNQEYELISQMNSLKIDDRYFYYSEFSLTNGGKKVKQISGVTEMDEYYLAFVATDNLNDVDPEIWQTIKSINFNKISDKENIRSVANPTGRKTIESVAISHQAHP